MARRLRILRRRPSQAFIVRAHSDLGAWAMVDLLVRDAMRAGIPASAIVVAVQGGV